jgi:hypothetical protein
MAGMPKTVVMDGWKLFKSTRQAELWVQEEEGVPARRRSIQHVCMGYGKTVYGHSFEWLEDVQARYIKELQRRVRDLEGLVRIG